MFQLNKIAAHIKLMENRRLKLTAYLSDVRASVSEDWNQVSFKDRQRIEDIERQIRRMDAQIEQYSQRLAEFKNNTPE